MVKAGASEFRGAYYSHGKQFIENIPIRQIDFDNTSEKEKYNTIIKLVETLIKTKVQLKSAAYGSKKTVIQRKADTLFDRLIHSINGLYGISEEEFRLVMNDDMFTTELAIEE
jgi:ribosomal protein L25 (general stress protein Ctc)